MLKVNILYIANIFSVIAEKFAFAWHLFWFFGRIYTETKISSDKDFVETFNFYFFKPVL